MEIQKFKNIKEALEKILPKDLEFKIVHHRLKKGDSIKRHYHPKATEWFFIDNGNFEIKLDDEKEIFEPKGDLLVFKFLVTQKHSLRALTDISYIVIRDRDDETIFSNRLF